MGGQHRASRVLRQRGLPWACVASAAVTLFGRIADVAWQASDLLQPGLSSDSGMALGPPLRQAFAPVFTSAGSLSKQGFLAAGWAFAPVVTSAGSRSKRGFLAAGWASSLTPVHLCGMRRSGGFLVGPASNRASAAAGAGLAEREVEAYAAAPTRGVLAQAFAVARAVLFALSMYSSGLFFMPAIMLSLPFAKKRDPTGRRLIDRLIMSWARCLCRIFFRLQVVGEENLPSEDEAYVYVANHQSFLDILSSYHLGTSFKFVSKASILKIPFVGSAMKATNTITIAREDRRSQMEAFRKCVQTLKDGVSIYVFPEGTRSKDGALLEFKKGPFAMARRAGTGILPITILGTNWVMPSGREYQMFRYPRGVQLVIHKKVTAEQVQNESDEELMASVRSTIESALPSQWRRGGGD